MVRGQAITASQRVTLEMSPRIEIEHFRTWSIALSAAAAQKMPEVVLHSELYRNVAHVCIWACLAYVSI